MPFPGFRRAVAVIQDTWKPYRAKYGPIKISLEDNPSRPVLTMECEKPRILREYVTIHPDEQDFEPLLRHIVERLAQRAERHDK